MFLSGSMVNYSSIPPPPPPPVLAPMTSRCQVQDGGPHGVTVARSKMTAPTASDARWRPHEVRYKIAVPVTRSVTPRRVSQLPRPREGSVTS